MARVTLADLLLLGAPDGKTEMIDGWVERVYAASTPAKARAAFTRLARELAANASVAWDPDVLSRRDSFRAGRCRLAIEGNLVILGVRVQPAVWEEFAGA